jgi:nucleotide-binding universal stress UspA family protein
MLAIRTVLCPVDFSPATTRQLALAADLCRAFGARLVLHHNLQAVPLGAGVSWMWESEHKGRLSEGDAEARLQALLDDLPDGIESEARVTQGPRAQAVLAVGEAVEADVVVLTSYGPSHDEHTSIAEQLLEHSNRSLLVLHQSALDRDVPHFTAPTPQKVLVATGLSPESLAAVELALELARKLPLQLELLFLAPSDASEATLADADGKLRGIVPEELAGRVRRHVEKGEPAHDIARAAERLGAACIVMGEHSHGPVKRWFRRDHSRAVLHEAHCPVWYVPGGAA